MEIVTKGYYESKQNGNIISKSKDMDKIALKSFS